jgi:hypothetical protein
MVVFNLDRAILNASYARHWASAYRREGLERGTHLGPDRPAPLTLDDIHPVIEQVCRVLCSEWNEGIGCDGQFQTRQRSQRQQKVSSECIISIVVSHIVLGTH